MQVAVRAMGATLCPLALVLLTHPAAAQFGGVSGSVSGSDHRPLGGSAVRLDDLEGMRLATTTDSSGLFAFAGIRPGTYQVEASHVGYEPTLDTIRVRFDDVVRLHLVLFERTSELEEVTVEDSRSAGDETPAGRFRITPQQLARVPVPGFSSDLMGYLIATPGTMRLADLGGQLFVRGGTPTQNLVLVDGMTVHQPFHIVGFYSAFPADIIAYTDVFAGGFGARYGGRLSSVIDVSTRNGSKRSTAADVSLAPFLTSLLLEFPIIQDEASLVLSGRESVIERIAPALANVELPYRFGDYFAKFHAFLNPTSSFSATALKTFDRGDFVTADDATRSVSWTNEAIGGRYQFLPAEYPVMSQFAVHVSRYRSRFQEENDERISNVRGINGDVSFTYLLGEQELSFGIFGRSNFFEYDLGSQRDLTRESISEGGGYVDFRWAPTRGLQIEPGLRLHAYSGGVGTSIEPRIRLAYTPSALGKRHTFGVATGLYRQQILGISSLDDLTDAFIAWAPAPDQSSVPAAIHGIASWGYAVSPTTRIRVEGYLKRMQHLSSPRFDRVARRIIPADDITGRAKGVDVQVERLTARVYVNLGYSLASVTYRGRIPVRMGTGAPAPEITFHPSHDRRHQINLAARYSIGRYGINVLWQYGSGQPFSQIYGFYDDIGPPVPDRAYLDASGQPGVAYAPPYSGRLPAYSRLDVAGERRFRLGRAALTIEAGVVNAYDRKNLFDFSLLTGRRIDQLPIIPYAGVKAAIR